MRRAALPIGHISLLLSPESILSVARNEHLQSPVTHRVEGNSLRIPLIRHLLGVACFAGAVAWCIALAQFSDRLPKILVLLLFAFVATTLEWLATCMRCIVISHFRCPRIIEVHGDSLAVTRGNDSRTYRLSDCIWYIGDSTQDQLGEFIPRRKSIVIIIPGHITVSWPSEDIYAADIVKRLSDNRAVKFVDARTSDELLCAIAVLPRILLVAIILGAANGLLTAVMFQRPFALVIGFHTTTTVLLAVLTTVGVILSVRRQHLSNVSDTVLRFGMTWWTLGWVASMFVGVRAETAALVGIVYGLEGAVFSLFYRSREYTRIRVREWE